VDSTSTFVVGRAARDESAAPEAAARRRPHWVEDTRRKLAAPGCYLAYEDAGRHVLMPLTAEVTRIGRSVAADLRFEDTTVSRRHAVLARDPDGGVRLLDDRSLNGVQVNGSRVESHRLSDGDEIRIGRHSLWFFDADAGTPPTADLEPALAAPTPT
jgi:pSer/pThr/pTyr-binding forkhead associated (FHA) protein